MENSSNRLYDEAILYFPFLTRNLVEWYPYKDDGFALIFCYSNGDKVFYDSIMKGIRHFSADNISSKSIDEDRWRKEIGFNIYRAMIKYGVDQTELAYRIGVSQGTVSKYTDGLITPSSYKLNRIAEALGCNINELTFVRRIDNI